MLNAIAVSSSEIHFTANQIHQSFQQVRAFSSESSDAAVDDRLPEVLTAFLPKTAHAIDKLGHFSAGVQDQLTALSAYLGEKDAKAEDLFGIIVQFGQALQNAAVDMAVELEKRIQLQSGTAKATSSARRRSGTIDSFVSGMSDRLDEHDRMDATQTIKTLKNLSVFTAAGARSTIRRGDFDEAVKAACASGTRRQHVRERSTAKLLAAGTVRNTRLGKMFREQNTDPTTTWNQ